MSDNIIKPLLSKRTDHTGRYVLGICAASDEPFSDAVAASASADTGLIRNEIFGTDLRVTPDCSPERAAAIAHDRFLLQMKQTAGYQEKSESSILHQNAVNLS